VAVVDVAAKTERIAVRLTAEHGRGDCPHPAGNYKVAIRSRFSIITPVSSIPLVTSISSAENPGALPDSPPAQVPNAEPVESRLADDDAGAKSPETESADKAKRRLPCLTNVDARFRQP
jgi:hypothetical protein